MHWPMVLENYVPAADTSDLPPWLRLHRQLQGRYVLLGVLALVLGVAGAIAGLASWIPAYTSTAQVRVSPMLPRILYQSEDNEVIPLYDGFVESQIALIGSQRVLDEAMRDQHWHALQPRMSPQDQADFLKRRLKIERAKGSQVIQISVAGDDPLSAQAAVGAILNSYTGQFGEKDHQNAVTRLKLLEARREELNTEHEALRRRMLQVAQTYGTADLAALHEFKMDEAKRVEARRHELEMLAIEAAIQAEQDPTDALRDASQLVREDPAMEHYLQRQADVEMELATARAHHRPNHPEVIRLERVLQQARDAVSQYVLRSNSADVAAILVDAPVKLKRITAQMERVAGLQESLRLEALDIGRQNLALADLREQIATVGQRLTDTDARLEELKVESAITGRINVVSDPSMPIIPDNLAARRQRAMLGGMLGSFASLGLVLMLSSADRRYRWVRDAEQKLGQADLLAAIPRLSHSRIDPLQVTVAGHSVHHLRAKLQLMARGRGRQVIAVGSAMPGEGKTSLVSALGVSFAASGASTLLVDFDFNGAGLTSRLGWRHRLQLGQIMIARKWITRHRLVDALLEAERSRMKLGDALVTAGDITVDQLHEALLEQVRSFGDVLKVLDGAPLETCVAETDIPQLSVLPVGCTGTQYAGGLAIAAVRRVLELARHRYDVTLLDTGPMLGSLEAMLAASQADGVVFVVGPDTSRDDAGRAMAQVKAVGGHVLGSVFNRAELDEIKQRQPSPSAPGSDERLPGRELDEHGELWARLGPLAHATARCSPPLRDSDWAARRQIVAAVSQLRNESAGQS